MTQLKIAAIQFAFLQACDCAPHPSRHSLIAHESRNVGDSPLDEVAIPDAISAPGILGAKGHNYKNFAVHTKRTNDSRGPILATWVFGHVICFGDGEALRRAPLPRVRYIEQDWGLPERKERGRARIESTSSPLPKCNRRMPRDVSCSSTGWMDSISFLLPIGNVSVAI